MSKILSSILSGLLKSLLEYFELWYTRKKNQELEWSLKTQKRKLDSTKEAEEMQKRIKKAADSTVGCVSPIAWNEKRCM